MKSPDDVVKAILAQWDAEEIILPVFVDKMMRAGFTRYQVYTYLEHECDLRGAYKNPFDRKKVPPMLHWNKS